MAVHSQQQAPIVKRSLNPCANRCVASLLLPEAPIGTTAADGVAGRIRAVGRGMALNAAVVISPRLRYHETV